MSSGSTHALYSTPNCELDFWYENLKSSLMELESFPADTNQLTVSNQLLKLRETLMDNGKGGTKVTIPPNIHVFPNQFLYRAGGAVCVFGFGLGFILFAANAERDLASCRASSGQATESDR